MPDPLQKFMLAHSFHLWIRDYAREFFRGWSYNVTGFEAEVAMAAYSCDVIVDEFDGRRCRSTVTITHMDLALNKSADATADLIQVQLRIAFMALRDFIMRAWAMEVAPGEAVWE